MAAASALATDHSAESALSNGGDEIGIREAQVPVVVATLAWPTIR